MKVLMLGWEFPPHISGGLGTACRGLTRGLAHHGVDVTFVVPRAFGDEDRGPTRILGCDEALLERAARRPGPARAAPVAGPGRGARPAGAAEEPPAEEPQVVAVDSALLPYLTRAQYRARVGAIEAGRREEREEEPSPAVPPPGPSASPPSDEPRRVQVAPRPLGFTGFYGPDLMAEVARYARVVEQIARSEPFDVVHAHDWMTYPAGIAAARATGRPLVVHLHASEFDRAGDRPDTAIRDIEQRGFDAADRIVCVSHYTAGVLRSHYRVDPERVRVVHNAVTLREQRERWNVRRPGGAPLVLFLGRVTFQKGPVYFLEAAARVARVLPKVRFVMSGSGDMLPRMVERAASMGLARHVRFTGFLTGADVERMYAMADLYVMPSVSEPFGISPLEAMALDVPVIVSRQSGVAEVLHSALKVDFWDVEALADKVLAVLRRPALGAVLASEGREEVRGMRWDARAERVRRVYEEVLR